jgi:tRNA pseudouridine55 synthase
MSSRASRGGREVDGILLLDKSVGISSNIALQRVKRLFSGRKAGHTGNLDVSASGLLPVCFGEATKVSRFLLDARKRYRAEIKLGIMTTTGDVMGDVAEEKEVPLLNQQQIRRVLARFTGPIQQVPPMHSAVKHQGKRLYELAHKGIVVERSARAVNVYELLLISYCEDRLEVEVECSKGTYVRTLAEDIGQELRCGAHVRTLRRLKVGEFDVDDALGLDALERLAARGFAALEARLLPIDSALSHKPDVSLSEDASFYLRNGQAVVVPHAPPAGLVRLYSKKRQFLGIGQILDDGRVAPRRLVRS